MAFNPFIGWSQAELESALRAAQDDFAAGKTLSSVGGGDANSTKLVQMTPEQRIRQIYQALNFLDPDTYPKNQLSRVTRTQIQFSGYTDGYYPTS
jgi:hypothetical protein